MAIKTKGELTHLIDTIYANTAELTNIVQEALITASYYAFKDGDVGSLNRILLATQGAIRIRGITMWVEMFAPARIKDEQFVLNKKLRNEAAVYNEADFAPFEREMRKVLWTKVAPKEKAVSVWDLDAYFYDSVVKTLEKHGKHDVATALKTAFAGAKAEVSSQVGEPEVVEADESAEITE